MCCTWRHRLKFTSRVMLVTRAFLTMRFLHWFWFLSRIDKRIDLVGDCGGFCGGWCGEHLISVMQLNVLIFVFMSKLHTANCLTVFTRFSFFSFHKEVERILRHYDNGFFKRLLIDKVMDLLNPTKCMNRIISSEKNVFGRLFTFALNERKQVAYRTCETVFTLQFTPHIGQVLGFDYYIFLSGTHPIAARSKRNLGSRMLTKSEYLLLYFSTECPSKTTPYHD